MLRRGAAGILALVLLSLSLTGAMTGAWACEGRTCGAAFWTCCCNAGEAGRHVRCDRPADAPAETALCRAECGCVLVITSAAPATGVSAAVSPVFPVAARIPRPVAIPVAPVLTKCVAHAAETRGPPRPPTARAHPSLRAPPLA